VNDYPASIAVAILDQRHPSHNAQKWARYDALYRGGDAFQALIRDFMPKNPQEPPEVYERRLEWAIYLNYVGSLVLWFAAATLSAPFVAKPIGVDGQVLESPPPFYAELKENADGAGTDLIELVRAGLIEAFVKGRSWFLAERPVLAYEPVNRLQAERLGMDQLRIRGIQNEQVLDWGVDDLGTIRWAILHSVAKDRPGPLAVRDRIAERWEVYDDEQVHVYGIDYAEGDQRPELAALIEQRRHGFGRVPLVRVGFAGQVDRRVRTHVLQNGIRLRQSGDALEGFWLLEQLAGPQIAHFRASSALDWSLKMTAYAMPVFNLEDGGKDPVMGTGYYIKLGPKETITWTAPPTAHLSSLADRCRQWKDEIFRVANNMAAGVDNNAAAIGRSGESKAADARATEIILRVYGAICRAAIEQLYQLLSDGRGDGIRWSIEGLSVYHVEDAATLLEQATMLGQVPAPSRTLWATLIKRLTRTMFPNADEATLTKIDEEIEKNLPEKIPVPQFEAQSPATPAGIPKAPQ
jgi:hypothetical protein